MLALDCPWNKFFGQIYPYSCGSKYSQLTLELFRGDHHMGLMMPHIQLYVKFNKFSGYDAGP